MRISDWSSDVCSSDLLAASPGLTLPVAEEARLSNGIRVVFSPRRKVPTVDMAIVFDAGTAADAPDKKGLGGFTLQLMGDGPAGLTAQALEEQERKSTRLNSSH